MLPRAGFTTLGYDDEMRLYDVIDVEEAVRRIEYDALGRLTKKVWPFKSDADIIHHFEYDKNSNLTSSSDGIGQDWVYGYDQFDRVVAETAPGAKSGPTTADFDEISGFEYDPNGNLMERITPRGPGVAFSFSYDEADRLVSEKNPAPNERWTYGYDAASNRVSESSPRSFTTMTDFDRAERPATVTDPLGNQTHLGYDRTAT